MSWVIRKLSSKHHGVRYKSVVRERGTGRVLKTRTWSKKALAEEWAKEQDRMHETAAAKGSQAWAHTFGDLVTLYEREEPTRAEERKGELLWWKETLGADTLLADVRTETIRLALRTYAAGEATKKMRDGRVKKLGHKRSGAAFNRRLSYASALWNLGAEHGLVGKDENPCRGIKRMREPPPRNRVLSAEEFDKLAEAARASPWTRLYLRVLLAVSAGGRPGEVERLRWDDIDWTAHTATVPADPRTGRLHKTAEETESSEPRVLFLTPPALAELRRFQPKDGEPTDVLIFGRQTAPGHKGSPYGPFDYRRYWEAALDKAGIPRTGKGKVTPYNLRHTNVTMLVERLLDSGVEESVAVMAVSKLAGHTSLQTTLRYVHARKEALRRVNDAAFGALAAPKTAEVVDAPALPAPEPV